MQTVQQAAQEEREGEHRAVEPAGGEPDSERERAERELHDRQEVLEHPEHPGLTGNFGEEPLGEQSGKDYHALALRLLES